MKQLVVNLSLDQYEAIAEIAVREQITVGEVVRRAVDQYLQMNRPHSAAISDADLPGITADLLDRSEHTAL